MESIPPQAFYSSASSSWIFLGLVSALRDECSLLSLRGYCAWKRPQGKRECSTGGTDIRDDTPHNTCFLVFFLFCLRVCVVCVFALTIKKSISRVMAVFIGQLDDDVNMKLEHVSRYWTEANVLQRRN